MKSNIEINKDQSGKAWVSGRSIFPVLGPDKTPDYFANFMRHRINMLNLVEGTDYRIIKHWQPEGAPRKLMQIEFTIESTRLLAGYCVKPELATMVDEWVASQAVSESDSKLISAINEGVSASRVETKVESKPTPEPTPSITDYDTAFDPKGSIRAVPLMPKATPAELLAQLGELLQEHKNVPANDEATDLRIEKLEISVNRLTGVLFGVGKLIMDAFKQPSAVINISDVVAGNVENVSPVQLKPETPRERVNRIVNHFVEAHNRKAGDNTFEYISNKGVWNDLYDRFKSVEGFHPADRRQTDDETMLDVIEREGKIDALLHLAVKYYTVPSKLQSNQKMAV